jgi:hypothetical protein
MSTNYSVRVLTRDPSSKRAQNLASLPNVILIQGSQDDEKTLHEAFHGVYGAWINLDGFTLGEMKELYYGFRAYEIARHEKVQHYVWANCDYALRIAGWDEQYHWGHNDAKGRVGGESNTCLIWFHEADRDHRFHPCTKSDPHEIDAVHGWTIYGYAPRRHVPSSRGAGRWDRGVGEPFWLALLSLLLTVKMSID